MRKKGQYRRKPKHALMFSAKDTISIRNLQTGVELVSMLGDVSWFISEGLSLDTVPEMVKDKEGRDSANILLTDGITVLARLRLVPQAKKGIVTCKGFGFLEIQRSEDGYPLLNPQYIAQTLSRYAVQSPFEASGSNKPPTTILFRYGKEGKDVKDTVRAEGRKAKQECKAAAGAKLRALVEKHDGSMHLDDWPKEDRKIVNELGKMRKLKGKDAAEAAGVTWNPETLTFSF